MDADYAYELWLADLFKGTRQPFSGSSPHKPQDVVCKNILIEGKSVLMRRPALYSMKHDYFYKCKRNADRKGLMFNFSILIGHYSMSIMRLDDLEASHPAYFRLQRHKAPIQNHGFASDDKYPNFIIRRSMGEALDAAAHLANNPWRIYLSGWEDNLVMMRSEEMAKLLDIAGVL